MSSKLEGKKVLIFIIPAITIQVILLILFVRFIKFARYTDKDYEILKYNCEVYQDNAYYYKYEADKEQARIKEIQKIRDSLENEINFAKGKIVYCVTLEISKSSFTLDIGQHIADSANAVELEIPVDKDFYDSVRIGQKINESFNSGSFFIKGKFSSNNVKVINKYTKERNK